jgi:hypothetical protein
MVPSALAYGFYRRTAARGGIPKCSSYEGRGWKLVSPRRVVMAAEVVVQLERRTWLDCSGASQRAA